MALKAILESLDGLSADVSKEYKEGDDGKFHLDIDGLEDHPGLGALKRAKDHEKTLRQKAQGKASELETKITELTQQLEDLGDGGKLDDKTKARLERQITDLTAKYNADIGAYDGEITTLLVDNVANTLAKDLSDSPNLLLPHIRARLAVEKDENGKRVTRVKDKDGEISHITLDEFKKELSGNKEWAAVLRGSQGSGSGAPGSGGGGSGKGSDKTLDYSKASPKDIAADIKARKAQE